MKLLMLCRRTRLLLQIHRQKVAVTVQRHRNRKVPKHQRKAQRGRRKVRPKKARAPKRETQVVVEVQFYRAQTMLITAIARTKLTQ